jgi:hypothetical protein
MGDGQEATICYKCMGLMHVMELPSMPGTMNVSGTACPQCWDPVRPVSAWEARPICGSTKHGKISFVTGEPLTDPEKINDGKCKGFEERK